MNPAIETRSLSKIYRTEHVVRDLDWSVPVGTACAFLGPNGAGKSTTLRMLMGFTPPTRGAALVLGEDPWDMPPSTRARVAYVSEQPILPAWLKVGALLDFHRSLYPRWDRSLEREIRDLLAVDPKRRVSDLSKGGHRRVMLVLALAQGAELLLLDEPGGGLDVAARRQLNVLLADWLANEARTLILSTHLVTDVEAIATRVTIIDRGALLADAELDELKENVKSVRMPRDVYDRLAERWEQAGILAQELDARSARLMVRHFATQGRFILRDISAGEVVIREGDAEDVHLGAGGEEATVRHLGLEDIFLALTSAAPTLAPASGEDDGAPG